MFNEVGTLFLILGFAKLLEGILAKHAIPSMIAWSLAGVILSIFSATVGLQFKLGALELLTQVSVPLIAFHAGVSLSLTSTLVKRAGKAVGVSFTSFALSAMLSLAALLARGNRLMPSLATAIILSNTSTELVLSIVNTASISTKVKDFALSATIADDIFTIMVLTILAAASALEGREFSTASQGLWTLLFLTVVLIAFCLARLIRGASPSRSLLGVSKQLVQAAAFGLLLLIVALSQGIGVAEALAAFIVGLLVNYLALPRDPMLKVSSALRELQEVVKGALDLVFLPALFVYMFLRSSLQFVDVTLLALLVVATTVGKLGGALLAARDLSSAWEVIELGALLLPRGPLEGSLLTTLFAAGIIGLAEYSAAAIIPLVTSASALALINIASRVHSKLGAINR